MATDTASLMSVLSTNAALNAPLVTAGVSINPPDNQALAYNYLDGISSNTPTVLNATALALIPTFDGVVNKLSVYLQTHTPGATGPIYPSTTLAGTSFQSAPGDLSPADFESWNTAYQKEYLQANGCTYGGSIVIGGNSAGNSPAINVVLSSNSGIAESQVKVIVMQNLTKTSFATMSNADQTLTSSNSYFATIANSLGLSTAATLTASGQQTPQQLVQAAIAGFVADASSNGVPITYDSTTNTVSFVTGQTDPTGAVVSQTGNKKGSGYLLCYNDVSLFTQELQNELTRVNNMVVYSVTDINNAISAVQARYKYVSAFGTIPNQVSLANINNNNESTSGTGLHDNNNNYNNSELLTKNVVSTDTASNLLNTQSSPNVFSGKNSSGNYVSNTNVVGDTVLSSSADSSSSTYQAVPDTYSNSSNQSTIQSGYQKLINAETQVLGLQNQMNIIASTGVLQNKQLDVPDLIFYLQLYTNLTDEQENAASTEIVNQQNDLLNAYSAMQQIINQVQSAYDPTKSNQQLDIVGDDKSNDYISMLLQTPNGNSSDGKFALTTEQLSILSMFDSGVGGVTSPIEKAFGIVRPTFSFFNVGQNGDYTAKRYTSTSYNAYGTSLSDSVTQINQQTQIMMNNINDLDKEKNEHFDLANNALSKASDIYQAIGNNLNG